MTTSGTAVLDNPGPLLVRLVRSELIKIRTTSAWWWFAIGALLMTLLAFAANAAQAHFYFSEDFGDDFDFAGMADVEVQAANIYTSGQFFGLLFVMLLGILMVTNEFFHQTATATFLTTPARTAVIMGKLATAVLVGCSFWIVTTLINLGAGAIFLSTEGFGSQLDQWPVQRAILLNLLAYAIWTTFGIGVGSLITNQLGATIAATVAYLIGTQVVSVLFFILAGLLENDTIVKWSVLAPSIASQVMVAGGDDLPMQAAWWVGALVLAAYAAAAGAIGIMITRKRDIS